LKQFSIKWLLGQVSFFGSANVVNLAVPFILIPFLALAYTPSDYRVLSMFQMLVTFFAIFIGMQSVASVVRYTKNDERDFKGDRIIIGSSFYIYYRSFLVLSILVFFIQNILSDFLKINNSIIWLSFCVANLYFFWQLYLNYSQAKENGRDYLVSTVIHALISLFLTLAFLAIGFEFNERITAIAISALIIGAVSRFKLGNYIKVKWNNNILKRNFWYGVNLIPHGVFVFMLAYIDKIYVNTYFTESVAGSYFLMFTVAQACLILPTALNLAYRPWFYNNASDFLKIKPIMEIRNIVKIVILIGLVCALIGVFAYLALLFLGERNSYEIIRSVFIILCVITIIDSYYTFAVNILLFLEKTKTVSMITFTSLIFTVILLSLLGPIYGVFGAALSCMLGSAFRLVLSYTIGMNAFKKFHLNK
jgi:O-antigen/teichoic acid export membrane protein